MKKFSLLIILGVIFTFQASAQNLKTVIAAIGCKQITQTESIPTVQNKETHKQWLKDNFGVINKTSFSAKCSIGRTYYRFLFEEEIFENGQDAANRLKNLQTLPEKEHDKSDYSVPKILAEGFVRGKKLYTVGAYAVFIEADGHLTKLTNKLKAKIK